MSRIRSIHPGLFTDEAFVCLSPMSRILLMGLWTECDDDGIFEWSPLKLKMRILPADNADAPALLDEMLGANVVMRFEADGKAYGAVRNFCQYQRPQKPKAIHPKPEPVRDFINIKAREKRDGTIPVQDEYDTPPVIPRQMEDEGGKMETDLANAKPVKARKRAAPAQNSELIIPDWVPAEPWEAFVEMRRALETGPKKIPFTRGAVKAILENLEKFLAGGHDIGAILTKSAVNGYRGVFCPDDAPKHNSGAPAAPVEDKSAYLAAMADKPWMQGRQNELSPPRNPTHGRGPVPIGDLVTRIAANA